MRTHQKAQNCLPAENLAIEFTAPVDNEIRVAEEPPRSRIDPQGQEGVHANRLIGVRQMFDVRRRPHRDLLSITLELPLHCLCEAVAALRVPRSA